MCKVGIYLVCDYPNRDDFLDAVRICEESNIEFLEVGFPFSDPVADGPVIEKAALDVLKKENTDDFIESLRHVRDIFSKKLYIMSYANVIFGYGIEDFARNVNFIDGIIVADLPFVESREFETVFDKYGINIVHFVTPESSFDDIDKIKENSKDFIYFVSTRGITGGGFNIDNETKEKIRYTMKNFQNFVILGFGIKNRYDIKEACRYADGVVIGTEAVRNINNRKFKEYINELKC